MIKKEVETTNKAGIILAVGKVNYVLQFGKFFTPEQSRGDIVKFSNVLRSLPIGTLVHTANGVFVTLRDERWQKLEGTYSAVE
jgi:hypothetical protein